MNKLGTETSTYLLQHANNPVDWYPWGEAALKRSVSEDKPILLSIGYAACHWCHVMEHESFEDQETAKIMNENFVCIKVDREERTDLDEIYMKAVQLMTGHGGWPMTVFLTPQLKPFFGGTYFPPVEKHGLPGFKKLLVAVKTAWLSKRDELERSAQAITDHMTSVSEFAGHLPAAQTGKDADRGEVIIRAARQMLPSFDNTWGGFGSAPKFPHTFSLNLAMRCIARPLTRADDLRSLLSEMVTTSLNCMANGGIHDQIGGGFARYATDRKWLVPHFEKMLYDNALLCQTYFNGFRLTGNTYWRRVAEGILDFVMRDLTCPEGAFYSSLDADSEGVEGKYYLWTKDEVEAVLTDDAPLFCQVYGVSQSGNFEHGTNILHLAQPIDEKSWPKILSLNERLLAKRRQRVAPGVDEKILTSWNSLMISAFVDGYAITGQQKYLEAAKQAASFILKELAKDGRLLRTWGQGKAQLNGYLDDYAYFTQSLLDLASVDSNPLWLTKAVLFNESTLKHFIHQENSAEEADNEKCSEGGAQQHLSDAFGVPPSRNGESRGGSQRSAADRALIKSLFYYTSDDHESLLLRPRNDFDGAVPSASAVVVLNLLRLSEINNDARYCQIANATIRSYETLFETAPDQLSSMICALDFKLSEPPALVLSLPAKDMDASQFLLALHDHYLPNKVVVVIKQREDQSSKAILLKDKKPVKDMPTVFICQNFTCQAPIVSPPELRQKLAQLVKGA